MALIKHHLPSFIIICILILAGFLITQLQPENEFPFIEEQEKIKDPNKLYPQELFFLDRNYPDYQIPGNLFQQRLAQAIRFDESQPRSYRGLDFPWTVEGPGNIGGRVNAIAVHPLNSQIIILGYSQGGMYHSKDGGMNWRAVFDDQPSLSISDISFDLQTAGRVYATTGDVNISGYPFIGSGAYLSDDGGLTWQYTGLGDKGVLSKIEVDPFDHNILYVGSMGFPSHKGDEKGFFRSTDKGETWNKTLTIDDSTGIIDIVTDPTQPGRVFAIGWTRLRTNTYGTTLSPGTSVYRSDDYGETWINLINGLPGENHSRTSVDIANDGTLFVSYMGTPTEGECAGESEKLKNIFKSHDAGMTWDTVPSSVDNGLHCDLFGNFGWYFEALRVNPENSLDIFLLGVDLFRTLDGGLTWFEAAPIWWTYEVHADKHALEFAAGKMYLGTDGGAYQQPVDGGAPWVDIENIPSTQFYRTTFNPHVPDQYFGGAQDNGTTGGNESIFNEWPRLFGGDGFQPLFDPDEPSWMYALTQNGVVWYTPDGNFWDQLNTGLTGTRFWDMPFIMSPHDSKILFAASNVVFRLNMTDTLREWKPVSPDLTKGQLILGDRYPAITALALSALDSLRLYAGTQDGKLWTSPDAGTNWIDLSEGTPGHFVTSIMTSTVNPQGVFVTYSGYRENVHTPYIYRSEDAGENWNELGANFPMLGVNNLLILPESNDEILFAGTDGGVYVTIDGGYTWERLGTNFPYMPVYDLEYNPVENKLVAATFSRGLMTFPIEELELVSAVDPVSEDADMVQVVIYPTIVDERFFIDFGKSKDVQSAFQIDIIGISGRIVQTNKFDQTGSENVQIEIKEGLPHGIYFIHISDHRSDAIAGYIIKQ